jgi:CheY-like chemotaxis protein
MKQEQHAKPSAAQTLPVASAGEILVVDDDQEVREAICDVLSDEGYVVAAACNGAEALNVLRQAAAPPSLIVLDLTMPVMDGFEFLERRRMDVGLSAIPVVVVSATIDSRIDLPGVVVVRKPIELESLLAIIARQLDRRAA